MVDMGKDFFESKKKKAKDGNKKEKGIDDLIDRIRGKEGTSEPKEKRRLSFELNKRKSGKKANVKEKSTQKQPGGGKESSRERRQKKEKLGGILGKLYSEEETQISREFETFDRIKSRGEEVVGEVLEEGDKYRIIRKPEEEIPYYIVFFPELSGEDKKRLKEIEKRAIAEINIDPDTIPDKGERWKTFMKEVRALMELRFSDISREKQQAFAELVVQDMIGYGLLEPLLNDDNLEEVMVIGVKRSVYVYHRKQGMCRTNIVFEDNEEIMNIINRIARSIGRRVDLNSPLLDARLPDGSRVNATIRPVSLDGASLTIRKFKKDPLTLIDIINFGTMDPELAGFLWLVAEGYGVKPANFLVSGGTGSGKTTTLNCLGSFIPHTDRAVSIEDTAELQLPLKHWIRLETRPPNLEGKGEISMNLLLKNVLHMRPDRIIVGEVRGGEAMTLLASMNTGQNGCLGTLHANTARETVTRLTSEPMEVPEIMIPSLDFIFMQNRFSYKGKAVRRITEITEVAGMEEGKINLNNIYEWDPKDDRIKPTGMPSVLLKKIAGLRGVSKEDVEKEIEDRTRVIRYMQESDIKGVDNVGRVINEYYTNKEELLEEIEKPRAPQESQKKSLVYTMGGVEEEGEVLEEDSKKRIVKFKNEKNPRYIIKIPALQKKDIEAMEDLEIRAINEIKVDPETFKDQGEVRNLLFREVLSIIERAYSHIPFSKRKVIATMVVNNMVGYGLLDFLLGDSRLEDIMVVGTGKPVYVNHIDYGICMTSLSIREDKDSSRIIEKIASSVGRTVDKSKPLLDARLPDGSRVNATLPPVSLDGPTITIRKFKEDPLTVMHLIDYGTLSYEVSAYLWTVVGGLGIKPGNVLAAGGASSGKTTTLNVLCSFIPTTERVITIEDTAELTLPIEHVVRLETKPPNIEGRGEITMDDLVKNTLRMRPDRIVVGEVRGGEARTLFTAMNTGHDGCMGTLHSNSAQETIVRLTNPPMNVPHVMLPALDLVLMQSKIYAKGKTMRRITEVAEVVSEEEGGVKLNNVFEYDPKKDQLVPTGQPSVLKQKLAQLKGIGMEELNEEIESREKVLKYAHQNGKEKIDQVSDVITSYYADPESYLEEIEIHSLNR